MKKSHLSEVTEKRLGEDIRMKFNTASSKILFYYIQKENDTRICLKNT